MSEIFISPLSLEFLSLEHAIRVSPFSDALNVLDVLGDPTEILQSGDLLTKVAEAIATKDPDAAAQLLNSAVKAESGATRGEVEKAWRDFTKVIEGFSGHHAPLHLAVNVIGAARTALKSRSDSKLVSFSTLKNVLSVLRGPASRRCQWILEGMKTLQVPNARAILNSSKIRLNERKAIYLHITKGSDVFFHVADDIGPIFSKYITITIETPKNWDKPLTEEEIRLLITRAILIAHIKAGIGAMPPSYFTEYKKVWPNQLSKPLPLITVQESGLFQYGPLLVPSSKRKSFYEIFIWLVLGSRAIINFRDPRPRMDPYPPSWAPFFQTPRASEVTRRSIPYWIPASANQFMVLIEIDQSLGKRIHLGLEVGDSAGGARATFKMSQETFKELSEEDFLDLVWRSLSLREEKYSDKENVRRAEGAFHDRKHKKPKPPDKRNIGVEDLRNGTGLNPQTLLGREFLKLVLAYYQILQKDLDPKKIYVPNKEFMNVLRAIRIRTKNAPEVLEAAWEDLLSVRYWHLQLDDSPPLGPRGGVHTDETKSEKQVVQIFPFGQVALIHILKGSRTIKPLDLLFLLSAMAANPGCAIKVNLTEKTVETGQMGETQDLYRDIAANPSFNAFHLYDPEVTLPEDFNLGFPGGIGADKNPYYAKATTENRRAYTKALLWFAPQPFPRHWLPLATDSKEILQRKFRAMNLAWHPDRAIQTGVTREQQNLLTNSMLYWKALFAIYP